MIDRGMEFQQWWERVPTVKKCEDGVLMLERERERERESTKCEIIIRG